MKKVSFFIILLIAAVFAQAQELIVYPTDSAEVTANVTDGLQPYDIHIELRNNTASHVSITWGMIHNNTPATWEVGLCDNNNCYSILVNGGPYTASPIGPGDTLDMKMQYTAHSESGTGSTYVYAYITNDSANSVVFLNYKATLTVVSGINDNYASDNLKVFPNPASSAVTVSGLENAGALSFRVYDLKGALMQSEIKNISGTQIEIAAENFPAGEYVLKAFDKNGKLFGTSKFSKF